MDFMKLINLYFTLIHLLWSVNLTQGTLMLYARQMIDGSEASCFENLLLKLKNDSFSASSIWKNQPEFMPYRARMTSMVETMSKPSGQSWCPNNLISHVRKEWIEIDFHSIQFIVNMFTIGRGDGNFEEFVPHFYLDYSRDGTQWIGYHSLNGESLLVGNSDPRNVARTNFESPFMAKKIRIYPISNDKQKRACLRIGIYGCPCRDGVLQYSVTQGHIYPGAEVYDLRDKTYDIGEPLSNNLFSSNYKLSGGIGQLMDNVISKSFFQNDLDQTKSFHFVGWNRHILKSNKIEIMFKFNEVRAIKNLRFHCVSSISKHIQLFSQARIHFSIGGQIFDMFSTVQTFNTNIMKPEQNQYFKWVELPIKTTLGRYMKIELEFNLEWIVLSEIIIESEPTNLSIAPESLVSDKNKVYPNITTDLKLFGGKNGTRVNSKTTMGTAEIQSEQNPITHINANTSFSNNKSFGIMAIIAISLFVALLLVGMVSAVIIVIRRHARICSQKKCGISIFNGDSRGCGGISSSTIVNGNGGKLSLLHNNRHRHCFSSSCSSGPVSGPLLGDSNFLPPISNGTHSSSGAGSSYYKHPDAMLSYPFVNGCLPSKDYTTTMSSRSGTDYDIAGGNSLDGLIPTLPNQFTGYRQDKTLSQSGWVGHEYPYSANPYTRNSIDGSLGGSSNADYASASIYHMPGAVFDTSSSISSYPLHSNFNNFQLKPLNNNGLPQNNSFRLSQAFSSTNSPYKTQSPAHSTQLLLSNQFSAGGGGSSGGPVGMPHNFASLNNSNQSPYHLQNASKFFYNGTLDSNVPVKYPTLIHNNLKGVLPTITGVFGNSAMISSTPSYDTMTNSPQILNSILSKLKKVYMSQIDKISLVSRNQYGQIGFAKIESLSSTSLDENTNQNPNYDNCKISYLLKTINTTSTQYVRHQMVTEIALLMRIQHSSFLHLIGFSLNNEMEKEINNQSDNQNSDTQSSHPTNILFHPLCQFQSSISFIFQMNDDYENLYSFLQNHSITMSNTNDNNFPNNINNYPTSNKLSTLSSQTLLDICQKIADAMKYLEYMGIIHRDLAARNCIIKYHQQNQFNENICIVKITDVAISVPLFRDQYVECNSMIVIDSDVDPLNTGLIGMTNKKHLLPLRWMAPETIIQHNYTIKSDIWSFGVVLWEIFTQCQRIPYGPPTDPAMPVTPDIFINNAHKLQYSTSDSFLPCHDIFTNYVSPTIFDDTNQPIANQLSELIRECWHKNPIQRPSFVNIYSYFKVKLNID